jgi:hypothetical protein
MHVELKGLNLSSGLQGKLKVFEIASMPIDIVLDVKADKKWDPLLQQKLQDAAKHRADEIINLFTTEILKIDARVAAAMIKDPHAVNLADEQNTANNMGKQIAATMPAHIQTAVEKVFTELKSAHKELVKYQVKCAVKIAWSGIKISVAAARLGASHGADVHAWFTVGKEIYAIAVVIYELAKSADTVQKEVGVEYVNLVNAVAKVKKETKAIKVVARQLADVEPKCKKVDDKIAILRPKVTGMDEKSHGLAKNLDTLLHKAKAAENDISPKAKPKLIAMETKINATVVKISNMQAKVREMRAYADAIEITVEAFRNDYSKGVATTVKISDFLTKAKEMYDNAKEVIDLLKDVAELAA